MRFIASLIPLLALTLMGCRVFVAEDPRTKVRITAVSVLTSPKIGHATVTVKTPTTQETLDLSDYASPSNLTGADLVTLSATILKALVPLP